MAWAKQEVAAVRQRLKLSRPDFARLLGVDLRTIYRWENGESEPSGPGEAVLNGIRQALQEQPDGLTAGLAVLGGMAAMGGLGFLVYKLIETLSKQGVENEAGKPVPKTGPRKDRKS